MRKYAVTGIGPVLIFFCVFCAEIDSPRIQDNDTNSDSNSDSEGDSGSGDGLDTGIDTDSVLDSDKDTDTDADADSDADRDTDSNTDTNTDSDTDTDFDTDTDTGSDRDVVITIENGVFWNDIGGNRIEAHGAGFLHINDKFYWIGEDKSDNAALFKAVNCYASKDLKNWEFRNSIVTRDTHPDLGISDRIIERPKVIYNETTEQYVMWLHWEGDSYREAEAGVFYSDTIDGDYTLYKHFRPFNNMARDCTLVKDDDGTAYFMAAANNNYDMVVYRLTEDYLDVESRVVTLWPGGQREAPAMFKYEGRYYLITSGCTGWDPNQGKYASAESIEGPWTELKNIGDALTFDTQSTFVIPIYGSEKTTFVYVGDRWMDPDYVDGKYIWLPLIVDGENLTMDYYLEWQLNLTSGHWIHEDPYLSQAGWSLLFVDSEERIGEDGAAVNAFDEDPFTFWHTEWQRKTPAPPHELQIDLGAPYSIEGFRYLPRQGGNLNGTIADYQLYVSDDVADWGGAVATGTFAADNSFKVVTFSAVTGRYIRLVALSEISGRAYTSVAELDVIGSSK